MFRLLTYDRIEVRRGPMSTLCGVLYTATCMGAILERYNVRANRWEEDSSQHVARMMEGWK